jgi:hypothetical protein
MKLTPQMLKQLVEEEMKHFGKGEETEDAPKDTEEVDADEYADSLEKKIDYVKALKIEEARLLKRLAQVQKKKALVRESIRKEAKKV